MSTLERTAHYTAPADDTLVVRPGGAPWALSLAPDDGGTAQAFVTLSPASMIDAGAATWHALGEASAEAELYAFPAPVSAVRVVTTGAECEVEVAA